MSTNRIMLGFHDLQVSLLLSIQISPLLRGSAVINLASISGTFFTLFSNHTDNCSKYLRFGRTLHDLQVLCLSTSDPRGSGHELVFYLWQISTVFWGELFLLFWGRLLLFDACIWSLW